MRDRDSELRKRRVHGVASTPWAGVSRTSRGGLSTVGTPASRLRTGPSEREDSECHEPLADPPRARQRIPGRAHRAAALPQAPSLDREPTMTLLATTSRRPVTHAFVVPVVRELAPQLPHAAADTAW
jgi:hypothetical protein